MKKTLFKLLGCCMLAVMASCGSGDEATNTETIEPIEDTVTTQAAATPMPDCPGCVPGALCSTECLGNVQGCHSISDSEFTARTTTAGYTGTGYNPFGTVAKLCAAIDTADCEKSKVVLNDVAGTANEDNSKITLTFAPLDKAKDVPVYYRLALLRSICRDNPRSVLFHKASHSTSVVDIVMAVKAQDNSMKYFDLSDAPGKRNKTK